MGAARGAEKEGGGGGVALANKPNKLLLEAR